MQVNIRQMSIKNRPDYLFNYKGILIFTILDTSQLKKLMIVKIFTVWILCICLLIMQVDILKKNGNKYLNSDDSVNENKALLKNAQMFGMELNTKSKQ